MAQSKKFLKNFISTMLQIILYHNKFAKSNFYFLIIRKLLIRLFFHSASLVIKDGQFSILQTFMIILIEFHFVVSGKERTFAHKMSRLISATFVYDDDLLQVYVVSSIVLNRSMMFVF